MKRFKIITAFASALIMSLALAATVAAAPNQSQNAAAPSGLNAEICGNSVCLNWNPGEGDYKFQQVSYWLTSNGGHVKQSMLVAPGASEAQIQLSSLNMPSHINSDHASYSFQVAGMTKAEPGSFGQLMYSNTVALDVPILSTIPMIGELDSVQVITPIGLGLEQ